MAGCWAVTHGTQVTDATLELMAARGVFFEPNVGLLLQNYLEHKDRYLGIGNFTESGFALMEKGVPQSLAMFKRALAVKGLKLIMGTDAGAGAHGQNAREIVYRVQIGGQSPMDAINGATSLAAEAIGLMDTIGVIAPGFEADLIGVDGDPLTDITALSRVVVWLPEAGVVSRSARTQTRARGASARSIPGPATRCQRARRVVPTAWAAKNHQET